MTDLLDAVKFDDQGLVTAVAQDVDSGDVLMVAYMNRETLRETLRCGTMVYFSRSRQKRWRKGDTSGHIQSVRSVHIDCDGDALLFKVKQKGAACHLGYRSCFFRARTADAWEITSAQSGK